MEGGEGEGGGARRAVTSRCIAKSRKKTQRRRRREAELHLPPGPVFWVQASLDRCVLCRESESIPTHRVQHLRSGGQRSDPESDCHDRHPVVLELIKKLLTLALDDNRTEDSANLCLRQEMRFSQKDCILHNVNVLNMQIYFPLTLTEEH